MMRNERSQMTRLSSIADSIWACGLIDAVNGPSYCVSVDPKHGIQKATFKFRWTEVVSVLQTKDMTRVAISGLVITRNAMMTDVAVCLVEDFQLVCTAKSFVDTSFTAGSYVPFADKYMYVGTTLSMYPSVSIVDNLTGAVRRFIYNSSKMSSIVLLYAQSPPVFIGSFVAGTCVSTTGINYIYAGMVRSDSGVMTGMYIAPSSGSILNGAGLVNAMALEYVNPDSFIAGGLQLSDGAGLQAYLLCVNSLYRRVIYGMRYILNSLTYSRRILLEDSTLTSAVQGMVLVEEILYLVVVTKYASQSTATGMVSVLGTDMTTGKIEQQVHIYSLNASIQCADIISAGPSLILACTIQYPGNITQAVILAVNRELDFSKLPAGFKRLEENLFTTEKIDFKGTVLPMMMSSDDRKTTEYTFNTADRYPTINPSETVTRLPSSQPTRAPSGQPSSSPTSAPSVSPQPTSQPSSSGPTNTYKPTKEPTHRPTPRPSMTPTVQPSHAFTTASTVQPSVLPTLSPSANPNATPSSTEPTPAATKKPTRHPTVRSTRVPTSTPSVTTTIPNTGFKEQKLYRARESTILGQVVGGLLVLWILYHLYRWWLSKVRKVKEDKKRMKEMIAQDLPGKPRYPIFSSIVGVCCVIDIDDHEEEMEGNKDIAVAATKVGGSGNITANHAYTGQGANIDGPASFVDLEANTPKSGSSNHREAMEKERNDRKVCEEEYRQVCEHDQQALAATPTTAVEDGTYQQISELSEASSVS